MKNNLIQTTVVLLAGGFLFLAAPFLHAQDPVFDLTISVPSEVYYNPASPESTSFQGSVLLDEIQTANGGADPASEIQGFSLGIAHDPSLLSVTEAGCTVIPPPGQNLDFCTVNLYSEGFTVGVVLSFPGSWTITITEPLEVVSASYQLAAGTLNSATDPTVTTLATSDLLGVPPTANVVVVNGASIPWPSNPVEMTLIPFVPEFELSAATPDLIYYPEANPSAETFSAIVNLQENLLPGSGTGEYSEVQGASYGVGHDETLMQITGVTTQVSAPDGSPPDFDEVSIFANGMNQGLVFSIPQLWVVTYETPQALSTIDYQLLSGSLTGNTVTTTTTVFFSDSIGSPPVALAVVVDGAANLPTISNATLDLVPFTGSRFIRGDATQDANLDLADGIGVLSYLFLGEPTTCLKAMDMDQSNHVSISDGVQVLCSLFCEGSPAPSGPYPDCGVDLDSTLTCESFNACP